MLYGNKPNNYLYMKHIIFISLLFFFFSSKVCSQDYKTGLGVRLSPQFNCIDIKHFFSEKIAVEGMLNVVQGQATVVVLAEFSKNFSQQAGLNWYWGLGGAVRLPGEANIVVSADGILGLGYTFAGAPVNLSLDWKPAVEIINGSRSYPSGFGLAVRYVFK